MRFVFMLVFAASAEATPVSVSYFGGPVISHVKVHAVYWGVGVAPGLQKQLADFYKAVVNSGYIDQLGEYDTVVNAMDGRPGTNQHIGRGSFGSSVIIQPSTVSKKLTQSDIEMELEHQFLKGALPPPDADTLYMLHFSFAYSIQISFGISCSGWYADHEVYKSARFGNVYYALLPCDSTDLSNFNQLTSAASHELAEAITDPVAPLANQSAAYPAGWLTGDGEEIGDLCTNGNSILTAGSQKFLVQSEWLNSLGGCSKGNYSSP